MKVGSGFFYLFSALTMLLPVFFTVFTGELPADRDYVRATFYSGVLLLCGVVIDGFKAVLNKLDGK